MEKYNIYFDHNNPNMITIKDIETNRIVNAIACPPIKNGCDIITFGDVLNEGYIYNFGGLIVITTEGKRQIYHNGLLIAETK